MSHLYQEYAKEIWNLHQNIPINKGLVDSLFEKLTVDPPKDPSHGHMATNMALILSKACGKKPFELADMLCPLIAGLPGVKSVSAAGPGFINFWLTDQVWSHELQRILNQNETDLQFDYGHNELINVEYVSTNPTGPMHLGHCRGAIVGDVLAKILQKAGYNVVKEFYINDAGNQTTSLARSLYQRYLEALGLPNTGELIYGGSYLIPVAEKLAKKIKFLHAHKPETEWLELFRLTAIQAMMELIKRDLATLRIVHHTFTSEAQMIKEGLVDQALEKLTNLGFLYKGILEKPKGKEIDDWEPRPQLLFKATNFGDEVDRPLQKSDGSWTYFATDIAYHGLKFNRGAKTLINIWGADHGGYVKRLSTAVKALTQNQATVHCILTQMVRFIDEGQILKMSKRAGNFVTVDEAVDKFGVDVLRFMMLSRKPEAPLDFEFSKVIEQTKENPVFYVQYAYARCHSITRHVQITFPHLSLKDSDLVMQDFLPLMHHEFLLLIQKLVQWPRIIEQAARSYEPHRITYYLLELTSLFHSLWTQGKDDHELRFIDKNSAEKTYLHYALVRALIKIMDQAFEVLGIAPRKEM